MKRETGLAMGRAEEVVAGLIVGITGVVVGVVLARRSRLRLIESRNGSIGEGFGAKGWESRFYVRIDCPALPLVVGGDLVDHRRVFVAVSQAEDWGIGVGTRSIRMHVRRPAFVGVDGRRAARWERIRCETKRLMANSRGFDAG